MISCQDLAVNSKFRRLYLLRQPPSRGQVLGLATEAMTKPEETIWRVRGPPEELFPLDLDDAGLAVVFDAVDEEPSEPFFDELPADDWAA